MGFFEAVGVCFSKYFTFSGRARRPEFFWFVLFNSIASSIASYVDLGLIVAGAIPAFMGGVGPFYVLYLVIALIPTLAVGWRRLHDVGRSGWWSLLPLAVIFVAAAPALAQAPAPSP